MYALALSVVFLLVASVGANTGHCNAPGLLQSSMGKVKQHTALHEDEDADSATLADNGFTTCSDWKRAGATTNGEQTLTKAGGGTYKAFCNMEQHGGGWTRFATIKSRAGLTCSSNFYDIPESQEFVDTCQGQEWIFSRSAMIKHGGQLMAREVNAPHKTVMWDWLLDGTCTGEKFFKIVTGDYARDATCRPKIYDFSSGQWAKGWDGWCDTEDHTQFNCQAQANIMNRWPGDALGIRFCWGTRDTRRDGTQHRRHIDEFWSGWTNSFGSDQQVVENFDSWTGKSNGPVELFYRPSQESWTTTTTPASTPANTEANRTVKVEVSMPGAPPVDIELNFPDRVEQQ